MQDLIFTTLPQDDGGEIHVRVDSILTIRSMSNPDKAFLGLSNGHFEVVDTSPDEVIEKVANTVADAQVPY